MLFPWGLLFLFFCFWGMQLSKAALLRCSRWKIKICNGQNMGPHSPWWFVSRKPSLEMMTGAQRVATEEKCDVTLQKSSASLQNGDEASEGWGFFSLLSPSPALFFLSCEGRHALQPEKPFIHHSDCLWEWGRWLWGPAGFSFPAVSSRAWNKLDVSVRRWMRTLSIKADAQGPFSGGSEMRAFHLLWYPDNAQLLSDHVFVCLFVCCPLLFFFTRWLALCYFMLVCISLFARQILISLLCDATPLRCLELLQNKWMNFLHHRFIVVQKRLPATAFCPSRNGADFCENWRLECCFYLFM